MFKTALSLLSLVVFLQAGETADVKVYTSAKDSELRLARTATKTFAETRQPLETEGSVFVNPAKTFQTFWAIGGAITDASAEMFTKLPPENDNVFYQFHYYCWDRPDNLNDISKYISLRDTLNTPVWVGETGEKGNTIYWGTTQYFEANNIGWSFWPWKNDGHAQHALCDQASGQLGAGCCLFARRGKILRGCGPTGF